MMKIHFKSFFAKYGYAIEYVNYLQLIHDKNIHFSSSSSFYVTNRSFNSALIQTISMEMLSGMLSSMLSYRLIGNG